MALTLYHAPASFFSQRARFALAEKKVKYRSVYVEIHGQEQFEPWYVRLNPLMTVPTLTVKDGSKFIHSQAIIAFIDQITPELPPLFPDEKTPEGQKCQQFLELFETTKIEQITMGTLMNPEFTKDFKSPARPDTFEKSVSSGLATAKRYSEKYDDLRYEYLNKMASLKQQLDSIKADGALKSALYDMENILSQMETELGKAAVDQRDVPEEERPWLCCQWLSAADIYLATILHRLALVGYSHLWTDGRRPHVEQYYGRVLQRQSFRQSCLQANNLLWSYKVPLMVYKAKLAMPWVIGVSTVAAIAAGVYMYIRRQ